ncbi:hypothetical protein [Streptomyces morookaense]|uniref:Protein kinase domain-containing protein n=1 Tax=Streptomyces morookaense TaxID=1970 RepID=A0A7Y7E6L3_STRMO|nr:hypothetical protein [Streptomyces morookaense]NVK77297.1 hypothetical protein [Streptomyces morookaense]GHF18152.1 hypothetical protein GCM10010359_19780 [Streptomyces morookaense]
MTNYIDQDLLTLGDEPLGKGGQGKVWEVKGRLINGTWPVAFKEYSSPQSINVAALEKMVDFVPTLPSAMGRWWCERSSWPVAVVARDGRPAGFLMRQLPANYYIQPAFDPDNRRPAGFEFLLNSPNYLQRAGIFLSDRQRVQLLKDLAHVLGRLHHHGVVVGDLSPTNVMFSLAGTPSCYFIDCDAMRLRGRDVLPQVESPDWNVPDDMEKATVVGDSYKFALMAVRLFAGDQHTKDIEALTGFSAELGQIAHHALTDNPDHRPTTHDWLGALDRALGHAVASPDPKTTGPKATPTQPRPQTTAPRSTPSAAAPLGTPSRPPMAPPRATPSGNSSGKRAVVSLTVMAVLILIAYLVHKSGANASGGGSSPSAPATSSTSSDTEATAQEIDSLLAQAKGTRSTVDDAVQDALNCGAPGDDASAFAAAATARRNLLSRLSDVKADALDGGDVALPTLKEAWEASADADDSFQQWANSLASDTCSPGTTTSDYNAALLQGQKARDAKEKFLVNWRPIARRYDLPDYSWDEL